MKMLKKKRRMFYVDKYDPYYSNVLKLCSHMSVTSKLKNIN